MKTAIIKNIDGHNLIKKFDKGLIDAVETQKLVNENLKSTDEFKDFEKSAEKYYEAISKSRDKEKISSLKKDVEDKKSKLDEKIDSLRDELVAFHGLGKNEKGLSEKDYLALKEKFDSLKDDEKLAVDGVKIKDLRGTQYYTFDGNKIIENKIEKLGESVPEGAKTSLSEDERQKLETQKENQRLSQLSQEEIDSEYKDQKNKLMNKVSNRVIELEMGGESASSAKKKAFSEFQSELDSLKSLYGKSE